MPRLPNRGTFAAALASACLFAAGAPAAPDCDPRPVRADAAGEPLTRAERIERMDAALEESLRRFDACQGSGDARAGTGGGDAAGAGPGAVPADSLAAEGVHGPGPAAPDAAPAPPESAAAEGVRGEDADGGETRGEILARRSIDDPPDDAGRPSPRLPTAARAPRAGGAPQEGARPAPVSSSVPADIPASDNDSALEAQIRRAAMEEPDPALRAELWNEYRRFKGLPERPAAAEQEGAGDARDPG